MPNFPSNQSSQNHSKAMQINQQLGSALTLLQNHQLDEAARLLQQVLKVEPNNADANHYLGVIFLQQGDYPKAIQLIRKSLKFNPQLFQAYNNLGVALSESGKLKEAAINYKKLIKLKPDYCDAHVNLAVILKRLGQANEATKHCKLALQLNAAHAGAHNLLGGLHSDRGETEQAIRSYQKVISLQPSYAEAHNNLGNVFSLAGDIRQALSCYEKAIAANPVYAEALNNAGSAHRSLCQLKEAKHLFRQSLAINPNLTSAHSNILLTLNLEGHVSIDDIYQEHLQWEAPVNKVISVKKWIAKTRKKNKKLKVGYVSGDLRTHSVAFFFEPLLKAHDRNKFEIYCYSNHLQKDETSTRLQRETDHWRDVINMGDEELAQQIQTDNIDILVDLSGHNAGNRLAVFAHKPAPVQITWLGYPNTSGLSAMDYRITDAYADPEGVAEQFHSETLIRLHDGFLCFQGIEGAPVNKESPAKQNNYLTFGSFNDLVKISTEVIALWAKILIAIPSSRLILKSKQLEDPLISKPILKQFIDAGIEEKRVRLLGKIPDPLGHLNLYNEIDIGLDPFPYNGTTTTFEALWMGVPTITLEGDRHASRVGTSIMRHIGLPEFVAGSEQEYIDIAVTYANSIDALTDIRATLHDRLLSSPMTNAKDFAQRMEQSYIGVWEQFLAN